MERWWKRFVVLLILTLCIVQILLTIPTFRATFCLVEQLEGAPVRADF